MQLEKIVLQKQDSTFLGPNSLSWENISKNKPETGLHLCVWPGERNWNQETPQPPFEMFQNNKMCVCKDCSTNSTTERGCVCPHHLCTYYIDEPCQRGCWNPEWWPGSLSLFSCLSFFFSLEFKSLLPWAVQLNSCKAQSLNRCCYRLFQNRCHPVLFRKV